MIRPVGEDHDPRVFSTWCAKAIALIGKLPATLADRAIEVPMRRRLAGEHVERLRQDTIDAEGADLRRQAARWAADHGARDRGDSIRSCRRRCTIAPPTAGGRYWRSPIPWVARGRHEARAAAVVLAGDTRDDLDLATELLQDIQTILEDPHHVEDAEDPAARRTRLRRSRPRRSSPNCTTWPIGPGRRSARPKSH